KLDAVRRPPDKKGMVKVKLHLSKLGTVSLHLHRDITGAIKTLTMKREGEHWYAVFSCEIGKPDALPVSDEDVGIDLGVTHFAALSNGESAKSGLNKSINDAGWGLFTELLQVKAAWAGREVMFVNPYKTSQMCSGCGTEVKKDLSERWHSCECGCELDRDTNAAKNIL